MKKLYSIFLGIILFCSFSHAEVFYVSTMGNDSNDGKSWITAFADVQKAIDAAAMVATEAEPVQVWIAKGTYSNAGGTYDSSTKVNTAYVMRNNVEIYGGFAGTETKLDERVSGNKTILTTTGNYVFYNNYRSSESLTNTAKLDSVTIIAAYSNGIYNYHASPDITNCTISGNNDDGIFNRFSSPTISNCTISANGGSGIYNNFSNTTSSSPTISNCTISENKGHGIYNYACTKAYSFISDPFIIPTITNCTISGNGGSGIYNYSSNEAGRADMISSIIPTISNCRIFGNTGSGVYSKASARGGYFPYSNYCSISIEISNCTIFENGDYGIYNATHSNDSSSFASLSSTLTNCTISGNEGHGIYNSSTSAISADDISSLSSTLTNCTISENEGVGIYNNNSSTSADSSSLTSTITNCMIWGNTSQQINNEASTPNVSFCIIEGGYASGRNIITADPLLGELGDYGGPVETIPVLEGSPAIGAGIRQAGTTPDTDARGVLRSVSPTIGAFEYPTIFTLTVENGTGGGIYAANSSIAISANMIDGYVFEKWSGDVDTVEDIYAPNTTIVMPYKDVTISANYTAKIDPFGEPVVYPSVGMTIFGEVEFLEEPAKAGYVVAAFVGDELRGKSKVQSIDGRSFVVLTCYVNTPGEEIKFKIWNYETDEIRNAGADCTISAGSGDIVGDMDNPFKLTFPSNPTIKLNLALNEGWNQISFNVEMDSLSVRSILSSILDKVVLAQGAGTSFNPKWPDALNTLSEFNYTAGFWVNMSSNATVSYIGEPIDLSSNVITLQAGWNNIAYTPAYSGSVRTALATAIADGKIERIINANGNFNPSTPDVLNSLKTMNPGEGYWVKSSSATTITYDEVIPSESRMMKTMMASLTDPFGDPTVYTQVSMVILANATINGEKIPANSVVAAYVGDELRAKQAVVEYDGKTIANLTVQVASNGEKLSFKIWNAETNEVLDVPGIVVDTVVGGDSYNLDNLLELNASAGGTSSSDIEPGEPVIYPNIPMSLNVEVQIDSKAAADGDVVAVYAGTELRGKSTLVNSDGKTIANIAVQVANNGEELTLKVWDASAKRLYASETTIISEIGGEPYLYPNLLVVNVKTGEELSGFQLWAKNNNLTGDNAKPEAIPNSDGITNLEKFTFGLDASKATSYAESGLFKQTNDGTNVSFQYPVNKAATDVTVKALVSEDLIHWTEATATKTGESGNMNLFEVNKPLPDSGRLFFRVEVND